MNGLDIRLWRQKYPGAQSQANLTTVCLEVRCRLKKFLALKEATVR